MSVSTAPVGRQRLLVGAALAVAALVGAVVLLIGGRGDYTLHARFLDAGQLVVGNDAAVAGKAVGRVEEISLTDNGVADVRMSIDGDVWPLREGTRAGIRLRSLTGVANRYVELSPGDVSGGALPDGAVLGLEQTRGIVDLDQILDSFDEPARDDLRGTIKGFSTAARGDGRAGNRALRYLNPSLSQTEALMSELVADPPAVRRLLAAGAAVTEELGDHEAAISQGIENTATMFAALADERAALAGVLERAPATLARADETLARVSETLRSPVRPALRELRPSVEPLDEVLAALPPATRRGVPALRRLRRILPPTDRAFTGLPAVEQTGTPATRASITTLREAMPILAGLRQYGPDLVSGALTSRTAITGYYDANGHYARASINTSFLGIPGVSPFLDSVLPLDIPGLNGLRSNLNERCPGASQPPPADGSKPVIDDPDLCDPAQSLR